MHVRGHLQCRRYESVKFGTGDVKDVNGNVRINVTQRLVRVTIVAVEKQKFLHILSVCL